MDKVTSINEQRAKADALRKEREAVHVARRAAVEATRPENLVKTLADFEARIKALEAKK